MFGKNGPGRSRSQPGESACVPASADQLLPVLLRQGSDPVSGGYAAALAETSKAAGGGSSCPFFRQLRLRPVYSGGVCDCRTRQLRSRTSREASGGGYLRMVYPSRSPVCDPPAPLFLPQQPSRPCTTTPRPSPPT